MKVSLGWVAWARLGDNAPFAASKVCRSEGAAKGVASRYAQGGYTTGVVEVFVDE